MHTGRSIDDWASKHRRRRENPWVSITISRISKGHPVDPQVHPRWSAENPIGRRCQNPIAFAYNRPLSGCRPSNLHGASLLSSQWRVDDRETERSFSPSAGKGGRLSWKTTPTLYQRAPCRTDFVLFLLRLDFFLLLSDRSVYSIDQLAIQGWSKEWRQMRACPPFLKRIIWQSRDKRRVDKVFKRYCSVFPLDRISSGHAFFLHGCNTRIDLFSMIRSLIFFISGFWSMINHYTCRELSVIIRIPVHK